MLAWAKRTAVEIERSGQILDICGSLTSSIEGLGARDEVKG